MVSARRRFVPGRVSVIASAEMSATLPSLDLSAHGSARLTICGRIRVTGSVETVLIPQSWLGRAPWKRVAPSITWLGVRHHILPDLNVLKCSGGLFGPRQYLRSPQLSFTRCVR